MENFFKKYANAPWPERKAFTQFMEAGFGHGDAVGKNLEGLVGNMAAQQILRRSLIGRKKKPGRLSIAEWAQLYQIGKKLQLIPGKTQDQAIQR